MTPELSYLICANQRSGTTMLCRSLAATGVAGNPDEYLLAVNEAEQPGWAVWEDGPFGVAWGARDRAHYLELVYEMGTTPNGVFGLKVMWNNVQWILEKFRELPRYPGASRVEIFRGAFPNLHVVNVIRRDRVRQAVSWARAAQENVWVVTDDASAVPSGAAGYDFELLQGLERLIVEGEQEWRDFYAELGVTPCEIVYEDLLSTAGYEASMRRIFDHLGVAVDVVPAPRTRRQADAQSDEWVARYRSDTGRSA